ncbi:MAG: hypothetical protein GWO23_04530, partial [Gammaproteobacteria bacterium]|nr:hypothetical protein [Gammaproteobacteria bacterium]NIR50240.1 hypothetical protein [candidate division KSB1 bacterium]NIS25703.1 hypothetical protein [candidate division KSB1 bacterium]NIU26386.1 hypothetical protein [candidate division KSB1 bacterium]NIU94656.1 hypothetical protein [candidate division KSB1 bacterium]
DEFDIFIVPTVDDKLDSWLKTTPYMQPTIYMVENIYPNQPFALRLLFKGFSLSKSKNAFITYDVQIFDPQGKPTEDKGENLLAYNGPVKSNNYIVINQQFLRIYFDETYPPGDYEILVTATDQSSKKTYSK